MVQVLGVQDQGMITNTISTKPEETVNIQKNIIDSPLQGAIPT